MTKKKDVKQMSGSQRKDPKSLPLHQQRQESPTQEEPAHDSLRPTIQGALTLLGFNKAFGEISGYTLATDLRQQCELVFNGDLSRAEALLTVQAHTLDAIFNTLARTAAMTFGNDLLAAETCLRLALKAQSQGRATLETLASIRNPQQVAFVRQANIAHGPQQVNNAPAQPVESSRSSENENQQNKVLGGTNGEWVELKTAGTTSITDPSLETVGGRHRPKDSSR